MTRRSFLQSMALASVGGMDLRHMGSPTMIAAAQPATDNGPSKAIPGARPFNTIGLYVAPPGKGESDYYDFYQACGYNYLEFCEAGFARRPDLLPAYHQELVKSIAAAHQKGFKVWILLLAGMQQWKGPAESGNAGTFSALRTDPLRERLSRIREAVRQLPEADGFEFFAGDPGGDPEGRSTVKDCIAFARQVHAIVREETPKAGFAINLWAIAEWAGFPAPFSLDFWQKQVALSKAIVNEHALLGPECGVVFSLDNYYRSLALSCYDDAGLQPELYPLSTDVQALRGRDVRPILGWPYFLVDECDDGFITPNNVVTKGQSQCETRYIRAVIDRGRRLGLDGLVANAAFVLAEPLNIYAFGRMCHSAALTPDALLDEYANLLAEGEGAHSLAQVLRFIENHSNWDNSLPRHYRLKPLDCGDITSAATAQERLAQVVPRAKASLALPESPALYLKRLQRRLEAIATGNIGGVAPIVRPKAAPERKGP
jgi:hypothetical protein